MDDEHPKSATVKAIEENDVDGLELILESAADEAALRAILDDEDKGTWFSPLHHAAIHARVRCAEMLCEKGADVNKEDIKGRTCLHLACDAYRENSESDDDMRFEEIVIKLCQAGAAGIKDNAGKAPDCGESACLAVSAAVDRAWHAGESIRDGLEAKRRARRKAKMDAIFAGKLASHINNASAAAPAARRGRPSSREPWRRARRRPAPGAAGSGRP